MSDSDGRRIQTAASGRDGHADGHADGSMIRSEERLQVTTEIVPAGRIQLRKYLVTEEQTFTVPVTREESAVDYEEIPDYERVPDGTDTLSDGYVEVVRHEERVVVTKQVVAVERVRLVRRVVTAGRTVTGQVRREVVDVHQLDVSSPGTS